MSTALKYRPDIDGLRALAVLAVLFFHALPDWNSGGYVGVDVFFVISGFLISGIVLKELARKSFSIVDFYVRRIRRLLPALLTVLAATSLASWVLLYPQELIRFGTELLNGAGFVANLGHVHEDTGYFAINADHKVLLHLWSLGVEEQFYLIWPPLLALAFYRNWTLRVMLGAVVVSLLFSAYFTPLHAADAFYLPTTRFWELGIGALLAYAQRDPQWDVPARLKTPLGVLGLVLIALSICKFTPYLAMPGIWALLPTLGAALCIGVGPSSFVNRTLLSNRVWVYIGKISYPLYLWHWPLLAIARVTRAAPPSSLQCLVLLGVALLLAIFTYEVIEAAIRHRPRSRAVTAGLLAGLLLFIGTGVLLKHGVLAGRLYSSALVQLESAQDDTLYPGRFNLRQKSGFKGLENAAAMPRANTTLFIGDSHMEQYWPRIVELQKNAQPGVARRSLFVTHGGCSVLPELERIDPRYFCSKYLKYALSRANDPLVDTVVFSSHWEVYFGEGFGEQGHSNPSFSTSSSSHLPLTLDSQEVDAVFERFEAVVAGLRGQGKRVYLILSNPTSDKFSPKWRMPNRFVWAWQATLQSATAASISRHDFNELVDPVTRRLRAIALRTGAQVIDPSSALCEGERCFGASADGALRFRDGDHLRSMFVRDFASYIDRTLVGDEP
jgi:peptidoglycan/LPS O-acetylase OafA/YrhL